MVPLAWAANRSLSPLTPTDSRQLGKRASIQLTGLGLGLTLGTPLYKKKRPGRPHKDCKVLAFLSGSETAAEKQSSKSLRGADGRKKNASSGKAPSTVEHTQAKRWEVKHGRLADSVSQSSSLGYKPSRYPGCFAVSAAFTQNSTLPSVFKTCALGLASLFWFLSFALLLYRKSTK